MTITVCKPAQLLALQAHATYLDSGAGSAYFVYYMGAKPASLNIAVDPLNALCVLPLPEPCFKQVLTNGIELHPTDTATATKAGIVTWARLYNGNDEAYADFTIGISGTHIVLNNDDIALGSSQKLDSIIFNPL
ncbi:hypothetical protein ACVBEE_02710 [Acinetobacter sp. ANC 3781]